jgi:hypothetical protein
VEANTASGKVSNAFEDLRVGGQWGAKRITGRLGAGNGSLKATTISGSIALLRRPQVEDEPWDVEPEDIGPVTEESIPADTPAADPHSDSGDNSVSSPGDGVDAADADTDIDADAADTDDTPADGTTDKKVL